MFEEFLKPVSYKSLFGDEVLPDNSWGKNILFGFPDDDSFLDYKIAIVGVKEDRASVNNEGAAAAPDEIRKQLYRLIKSEHPLPVFDAGNIEKGETVKDSYVALSNVVRELLLLQHIPVILGGSHDLTYAHFGGYQEKGDMINVAVIDSYIDLLEDDGITDRNFLIRLLTHQPNFIFNFSHIGYQTHFTSPQTLDTLDRLHFDVTRLGKIRSNTKEAEPVLRNANMVSMDMAAVRSSDVSGNADVTPNGLFAEDFCQLARFAGLSSKVNSFGIYGVNPTLDIRNQTTQLAAQSVWYFLDGFVSRINDWPDASSVDYVQYQVHFKDNNYNMVFWKSLISDSWWIEVPSSSTNARKQKTVLVPCSYADYLAACREEMPERWLKTYHKLA